MKLSLLYEETREGIGLKYALSDKKLPKKKGKTKLADNLAQATDNNAFQPKKNIRAARQGDPGKAAGVELPNKSRLATASPVPVNPRHRKFMGIRKPQIPY
jgi:hypothetical protein